MAASLSALHSSAPSPHLFLINTPYRSSFNLKPFHSSPNFKLNRLFDRHLPLKCRSSRNEHDGTRQIHQGFSILESDAPWESGSVWSSMGLYLFSLHIPLSFGGLSAIAQFLHQPDLAPETKALSLLAIQSLELFSTLLLLKFTSGRNYSLSELLRPSKLQNGRNWLLASLLGFLLLIFIVFVTSYLADSLVGTKDVNDPTLKQILSSGAVSQISCTLAYCLATPVLEELVYRRFFLTSLASAMNWRKAVFVISAVFSASHLSVENCAQLFVVGCVLGCTYCWTGDLRSSIALHSMYNAFTLILTFLA